MINSRGWFLTCDADDCAEDYDPPGGDEITDPEEVERAAIEDGWQVDGGKHYCPEHEQ